jgi:hypothetical protein
MWLTILYRGENMMAGAKGALYAYTHPAVSPQIRAQASVGYLFDQPIEGKGKSSIEPVQRQVSIHTNGQYIYNVPEAIIQKAGLRERFSLLLGTVLISEGYILQ